MKKRRGWDGRVANVVRVLIMFPVSTDQYVLEAKLIYERVCPAVTHLITLLLTFVCLFFFKKTVVKLFVIF